MYTKSIIHRPTQDILEEADGHPESGLQGPIQALKEQCKALADIADSQTSDDFAVSQGMKLKTILFSEGGIQLDAVITLKVEAKKHVEEQD